MPVHATTIALSFDTLASGKSALDIQNYIQGYLGVGKTVIVSAGAVTDRTYNGDGHVVGPCSKANCAQGSSVSSVTLGPDTFIRNATGMPSFSFSFTGLLIDSVSFDYEIFPDGTCTALNSALCGGRKDASGHYPHQPDFTFSTNLGTVFHTWGVTPASPGYTHSPASGRKNTEKAPQLLVVGSGPWDTNGATTLNFVDWPERIGIDNLSITYHKPTVAAVPEPGTMLLLGTGLAGLCLLKRKVPKA